YLRGSPRPTALRSFVLPAHVPPGTSKRENSMSTPSTITDARSAPPDRPARLGTVLFVIVTAYLMVGVDSTVVNVALPDIQQDLGICSSVPGRGASLGLVLGGMLTSWASWRWALLINVPIGIGVALALPRFVNETPRHAGRFDAAGALTGTAGMTSLVYA